MYGVDGMNNKYSFFKFHHCKLLLIFTPNPLFPRNKSNEKLVTVLNFGLYLYGELWYFLTRKKVDIGKMLGSLVTSSSIDSERYLKVKKLQLMRHVSMHTP